MIARALGICLLLAGGQAAAEEQPRQAVLVVVGAPGSDEFAPQFHAWAERWLQAAERGRAEGTVIGLDEPAGKPDRDLLAERLQGAQSPSPEPLWLVLIGHGTFDGKTARFNLRGSDVSAAELATWLRPLERPLVIINCASSSGPFLAELAGPRRAVVTATKSGHEYNFARLGDYLSSAIADPAADLNKDDQTSLLEAFLLASSGLKEFYAREARLATEHPLLDDNGDRLGTPADWFRGVRAVKSAKTGAPPDGVWASQLALVRSSREEQLSTESRARRDELEAKLAELRKRKTELAEGAYLAELEPLLVELAQLYETGEVPAAAN